MIPGPHRLKGGALQLGAEQPGLPGLFGTWPDEHDQEHGELDNAGQDDAELWC
ncbi:hypothetical protein [Streptomyces kaniharaensis]|uniref:hypothetical protein n=1 Tax=Streptomyces kaniharaensis TaxID=212423 RepID=UPI0018A81155|nr:hypothetical protein [Streptomyces kaniharaensis]